MAQAKSEKLKFKFENGQYSDNFVVHVHGQEALSECWAIKLLIQFKISDLKTDGKFSLKALLNLTGQFKLITDDDPIIYDGRIIKATLSAYSEAQYAKDFCFIEITFVPELYTLSYFTRNRTFLDMDVKTLLKSILKTNPAIKADYKLSKTYSSKPIATQKEESDLQFLNRTISQYGLFYTFETDDDGYYQVVFRDSNGDDDDAYEYEHDDDEFISDLTAIMKSVPDNVRIRDYNSDLAEGSINETVNDNDNIIDFINENVKDSEEAKALASIRYDQIVKDMLSFEFKSDIRPLLPGSFLEIEDVLENKLLIVKRDFKGHQASMFDDDDENNASPFISKVVGVFSDVCYRPSITVDSPILGLTSMEVCTSDAMYKKSKPTVSSTPSSPINTDGKYNVWIRGSEVISDDKTPVESPFSIRNVTPFAGSDRGAQMPLQIADELLVDIDNNPVIMGAVNNSNETGIYKAKQYTLNSPGQHCLSLDDETLEGIKIETPVFKSSLEMGKVSDDVAIKLKSEKGILITGKSEHFEVEAEFHFSVGNDFILREGVFQKILLGVGTKLIIGMTMDLSLALTFDFKSLHFAYFGSKANIIGGKNSDHAAHTKLTGAEEKLIDSKIKSYLNKNSATMEDIAAIQEEINTNLSEAKTCLSNAKATASTVDANVTRSHKCITKIQAHAEKYNTCVVKSEEKMVKQGVRAAKSGIKALQSDSGELATSIQAFQTRGAL